MSGTLLDIKQKQSNVRPIASVSHVEKHKIIKDKLFMALQRCDRTAEAYSILSCGNDWRVGKCEGCNSYVAYALICHHRLCPDCAERRASLFIDKHSNMLRAMHRPRMLTLTIKSVPFINRSVFERLRAYFSILRRRRVFKTVVGGIYSIETKYNRRSRTWHVHLHALIESGYIPQAELSSTWLDITGDSFVVDIRRVGKRGKWGAVREVVKYSTKVVDFIDDSNLIDQYLLAVGGLNLVHGFGNFCKARLREQSEEKYKCPVCGCEDINWNCDSEIVPLEQWLDIGGGARSPPSTVLSRQDVKKVPGGYIWVGSLGQGGDNCQGKRLATGAVIHTMIGVSYDHN